MTSGALESVIRRAEPADIEAIATLLDEFSREFDELTPGPEVLAGRVRELLTADEITVLLTDGEPHGVAVLRFRPALWTDALDCYVEELYVSPERRGQGLGQALMEAVIEHARRRGAAHIDLGTGEDDVAARSLYESLGFDNRGGRRDGGATLALEPASPDPCADRDSVLTGTWRKQ